jgi:Na+/melibiose symporter-like transporter
MLLKKLFPETLNIREKIAFRIHLIYSSIEGVILGVLALNEFVFIKSMAGEPMQLAFLFQFSMLVFLLSAFVNRLFTSGKRIKKLIRYSALLTRLPMIVFLFFPPEVRSGDYLWSYVFLSAFFLYYLANPLIYPNINYFLKNSYQHHNFGLLYSMSTSLNKIIMMIVTFIYGLMLDADPMVFRYVLPITGALAIVSAFILTQIPYKNKMTESTVTQYAGKSFFKSAIDDMLGTLKQNKPFLLFQIAFMFYGFAFMIGSPSINIFYKEVLDLNYISVAFYRNVYNIVAIAVLPFMGRLLGRAGPMKFGILTFVSLLFYFLFVLLSGIYPAHFTFMNVKIVHVMLVALVFHGLFASTMSLLWNIGSAYFGNDRDAAKYQNVHLFLTGVRAIPAPVLGVFIYTQWGFVACFSTAVILLLAGVFIIRLSLKQNPEK